MSLAYFGLQHWLDRSSEGRIEHGLGDVPKATISNVLKVLVIGCLSLLAGASLGPEAILVPAAMLVGLLFARQLFSKQAKLSQALAAAGLVALFVMFFNSLWFGALLGIFSINKQSKTKLTKQVVLLSLIASIAAYGVQLVTPSKPYLSIPAGSYSNSIEALIMAAVFVVIGYCLPYLLNLFFKLLNGVLSYAKKQAWWQTALLVGFGLSIIFLIGGPLIQFTGNESIVPMFDQAASLGFLGLAWVFFTKLLAIGWSHSFGYRGGLIFPMVFAASVIVMMGSVYFDVNFTYSVIAVIAGMLAANNQSKVLF